MNFSKKIISASLTAVILLAACNTTTPEAEKGTSAKIVSYTSAKSRSEQSSEQSLAKTSKRTINTVAAASASSKTQQARTPVIRLSTTSPVIGETMILHVENAKEVNASAFLGFQPKFYSAGENLWTALLPISYAALPGDYELKITADGKTFTNTVAVTNRAFDEQYLTVDPETTKNTAGSTAANDEWTRRVEPLKSVGDAAQHWENKFIVPIEGDLTDRITTEYGSIRYTNGSTVATRHSGIDLAFKTGTPVLATGNGRVLFADFLQLTGNTVIIEHGYGLKSFYYHMDTTSVEEGTFVEQGAQIGTVGSTGFSTGPHCHFAMAVNNVFTNPWTLIKQGL